MIRGQSPEKRIVGGPGVRYARPVFSGVVTLLLIALVSLAIPADTEAAREVRLSGTRASLALGAVAHGDVVLDTLRFLLRDEAGRWASPRLLAAEATCPCLRTRVLEGRRGELDLRLEVPPEEPAGAMEKVVYLHLASDTLPVVRLSLVATVEGREYKERKARDLYNLGDPARNARQSGGAADSDSRRALADSLRAPVRMLFFASPGCPACRRVKDYVLPHVREAWGESVRIEEVNLDDERGYARLLAVRRELGIRPDRSPFAIVVGRRYLTGRDDLVSRLDTAIWRAVQYGVATVDPSSDAMMRDARVQARAILGSMTLWAVLGAGLLDGLNPCAFATVIFLVALLGTLGGTKRQVLAVGGGFTLAVFSVYLALGFGAFHAIRALEGYAAVAQVVTWGTLVLLAGLVVLSGVDIARYRRTGRTTDQLLQLSGRAKRRIHAVMKKGLALPGLFAGSLLIGAAVSIFEAACTGQVYLPTIVLLLRDPQAQGRAVAYLLAYNVMFVLPLVAVFLLAWWGTSSEMLARWARRRYVLLRVLLGLLFLAMFVLLLARELL